VLYKIGKYPDQIIGISLYGIVYIIMWSYLNYYFIIVMFKYVQYYV